MRIIYHGVAGTRLREAFAAAESTHGHKIVVVAPDDPDALARELPTAEVWWHVLTPITATHFEAAPRLRLVQKWGVGVNTIDVAAGRARGVVTANMPGSNAAAVAESAVMLMLASLRSLVDYHVSTSAGSGWEIDADVGERSGEISGRTVGLVGYGDIAQRVEKIVGAMGATVVHHSRRSDRAGWVPLDELLATADIVSLHVPFTAETAHLLDEGRIATMPAGSVLVNTARGGLIDSAALAAALHRGHLGAAGLDVFESEPLRSDDPLFDAPRITRMPHVAWLTWETLQRSLAIALDNVDRVQRNADVIHEVLSN